MSRLEIRMNVHSACRATGSTGTQQWPQHSTLDYNLQTLGPMMMSLELRML